MKIQVDESKCIAAGNCVLVADALFDQRDEDGIVVVLDDSPNSDSLHRLAREAAGVCPSKVITIIE